MPLPAHLSSSFFDLTYQFFLNFRQRKECSQIVTLSPEQTSKTSKKHTKYRSMVYKRYVAPTWQTTWSVKVAAAIKTPLILTGSPTCRACLIGDSPYLTRRSLMRPSLPSKTRKMSPVKSQTHHSIRVCTHQSRWISIHSKKKLKVLRSSKTSYIKLKTLRIRKNFSAFKWKYSS